MLLLFSYYQTRVVGCFFFFKFTSCGARGGGETFWINTSTYHPDSLEISTQTQASWRQLPQLIIFEIFFLFGWFLNVLVNYQVISRTGPKTERLTILRAATHETELGDHDFYLSRSHYTDTDPTSRERAATAGIEPGTF